METFSFVQSPEANYEFPKTPNPASFSWQEVGTHLLQSHSISDLYSRSLGCGGWKATPCALFPLLHADHKPVWE